MSTPSSAVIAPFAATALKRRRVSDFCSNDSAWDTDEPSGANSTAHTDANPDQFAWRAQAADERPKGGA